MKGLRRRLQIQVMPSGSQVFEQHALGAEQGFQSSAVADQEVAFVRGIVTGKLVDFASLWRIKPQTVSEEKIR